MRLHALVSAQPVEVPEDTMCEGCDADDGPNEARILLDGRPTCTECLVGLTLIDPPAEGYAATPVVTIGPEVNGMRGVAYGSRPFPFAPVTHEAICRYCNRALEKVAVPSNRKGEPPTTTDLYVLVGTNNEVYCESSPTRIHGEGE